LNMWGEKCTMNCEKRTGVLKKKYRIHLILIFGDGDSLITNADECLKRIRDFIPNT
jgi:hypothetical protein